MEDEGFDKRRKRQDHLIHRHGITFSTSNSTAASAAGCSARTNAVDKGCLELHDSRVRSWNQRLNGRVEKVSAAVWRLNPSMSFHVDTHRPSKHSI